MDGKSIRNKLHSKGEISLLKRIYLIFRRLLQLFFILLWGYVSYTVFKEQGFLVGIFVLGFVVLVYFAVFSAILPKNRGKDSYSGSGGDYGGYYDSSDGGGFGGDGGGGGD